ncbi:MAG: PepSY domain-containing protein, partial [Phascolarctobacterium sp.]
MKKMTTAVVTGLATLAISATAFAAISAEEAKAIAAKEVPASSTHIMTKAEMHKLTPYFEVKFYDNATNTEYEIDVLQSNGSIKEYSMDAKTLMGSSKIVLSSTDVQNMILKDYPQAVFSKIELDRDN